MTRPRRTLQRSRPGHTTGSRWATQAAILQLLDEPTFLTLRDTGWSAPRARTTSGDCASAKGPEELPAASLQEGPAAERFENKPLCVPAACWPTGGVSTRKCKSSAWAYALQRAPQKMSNTTWSQLRHSSPP